MFDKLRERRGHLAGWRLGERLAELGGLGRGLAVERDDDVDLALDRLLEILPC